MRDTVSTRFDARAGVQPTVTSLSSWFSAVRHLESRNQGREEPEVRSDHPCNNVRPNDARPGPLCEKHWPSN
jgi:hypothetical protein